MAEFITMWNKRTPDLSRTQLPGTLSRKQLPGTLKYPLISLKLGRPLDRVIFVMAGKSGSGKSTTINTFFADEHLCPTNDSTYKTHQVTEYSKLVEVHEEQLKAYISFVDVPGTHDTDKTKEAANRAAISDFTNNHPALQDRHVKKISESTGIDISTIRDRVYPNMVLLTVSATDNRMVGSDACFTETLQDLKESNLIDTSRPNLIVVVTHSAILGFVEEAFVPNMNKMRQRIVDAVKEVLGIEKVIVVFVENMPVMFGFRKPEGSDFFALPNGEFSHYNLFEAMKTLFENNKDYFGLLLTGWYFGSSPVEKQQKATIIREFRINERQSVEIREAINSLNVNCEQRVCPVREWNGMYIGHGYCPRFESTRGDTIYCSANSLETKTILNKRFLLPRFVNLTERRENYSDYCRADSKTSYEKKRRVEYGLDAEVNFKVSFDINFLGKWEREEDRNTKSKTVSFLYEVRLANLRMDNIRADQLNPGLREDLTALPDVYSIETGEVFEDFFSKWGSHYVGEVWLGGSIHVFCKVDESDFNEERNNELKTKLGLLFSSFGVSSAGGCSSRVDTRFLDENSTVKISGGEPPYITRLQDLTTKVFSEWKETLTSNPVELERSIRLKPFYRLVEGQAKQRSMKRATMMFLNRESDRLSAIETTQPSASLQRDVISASTVKKATEASDDFLAAILSILGVVLASAAVILIALLKR